MTTQYCASSPDTHRPTAGISEGTASSDTGTLTKRWRTLFVRRTPTRGAGVIQHLALCHPSSNRSRRTTTCSKSPAIARVVPGRNHTTPSGHTHFQNEGHLMRTSTWMRTVYSEDQESRGRADTVLTPLQIKLDWQITLSIRLFYSARSCEATLASSNRNSSSSNGRDSNL